MLPDKMPHNMIIRFMLSVARQTSKIIGATYDDTIDVVDGMLYLIRLADVK